MSSRRNTVGYVSPAGERLVSVTEALKLAGLVDFSHVPEATLERARERGQDVHAYIEGLATGILDDDLIPDPRIAGYVAAYQSFVADTGFVALHSELALVSASYRYAGTIDLVGTMGGVTGPLWILDAKATAAVSPEAAVQTAGYKLLYQTRDAVLTQRGVIHLAGDGRYRLVEHKDDRQDTHDFLACLRIAHWKLRNGLAKQLED